MSFWYTFCTFAPTCFKSLSKLKVALEILGMLNFASFANHEMYTLTQSCLDDRNL